MKKTMMQSLMRSTLKMKKMIQIWKMEMKRYKRMQWSKEGLERWRD